MQAIETEATGCGSGHCSCGSTAEPVAPAPRINGVALHPAGARIDPERLRELACAELLRQEAVRQGLLPALELGLAPELDAAGREIVEAMVERAVALPEVTPEACQRYYEANKPRFVRGQALRLNHILFAVTPGVNVQALAQRAEMALLELLHRDVVPGRFAELARELSNCPSGAQGGELGWLGPDECAPELARELFFQSEASWGTGVHPRLVHSRFGFHIIEVLEQRSGRQAAFDEVCEGIALQLTLSARVTATRQYLQLLAGAAEVEGMALEGASSLLVQ